MTSELTGYVGGIRCVMVVNGKVALGVDLEQARIEDVDPDGAFELVGWEVQLGCES
jgi:hypothetical protein